MAGAVEWEMSPKQVAAFAAKLDRWTGLQLRDRMKKGSLAAAQYMVGPIKANTPPGPTGNLSKSVKARQSKASAFGHGIGLGTSVRFGGGRAVYQDMTAIVGPVGGSAKGAHRHLVIRGHRIVTHLGRDTGKRSRANPYVDRAILAYHSQAQAIIRDALFSGRSAVGGSIGSSGASRYKSRKSFAPRPRKSFAPK